MLRKTTPDAANEAIRHRLKHGHDSEQSDTTVWTYMLHVRDIRLIKTLCTAQQKAKKKEESARRWIDNIIKWTGLNFVEAQELTLYTHQCTITAGSVSSFH